MKPAAFVWCLGGQVLVDARLGYNNIPRTNDNFFFGTLKAKEVK